MRLLSDLQPSRRGFLGMAGCAVAAAAFSAPEARAARVKTGARVVIIGAGAAGTALANRLVERLNGATIIVMDARRQHLYQPGLSLVAAGLKPAEYVVSETKSWLPSGVTLVEEAAAEIDPEAKIVTTAGGTRTPYDYLIVAPGIKLDWAAIQGFSLDMVGRDGIGALYAGPDEAAKTWQAASAFIENGGTAIISRPATEMKCAGAPLKPTGPGSVATSRTSPGSAFGVGPTSSFRSKSCQSRCPPKYSLASRDASRSPSAARSENECSRRSCCQL